MMRAMLCVLLLGAVALAGCAGDDGATGPLADHTVIVLETSEGDMTIRFYDEEVPTTAGNFLHLAHDGLYDGSPFHRIIRGFMMQGGDYTRGDGYGGQAHPDFSDGRGNIPDEFHPSLRHDGPGVLSMANGGPDTGSSQFFITFRDTPHLDGRHAVFARVTDGFDVLEKIDDEVAGGNDGVPRRPVHFLGVQGVQCGPAAPAGLCADAPERPGEEGGQEAPESPAGRIDCPGAAPTPAVPELGPGVTAGAITPGRWDICGTDETLLLWLHNAGDEAIDVPLSAHGVPDGWDLTFDSDTVTLQPAGSRDGMEYTDWGWTRLDLKAAGKGMTSVRVLQVLEGVRQVEMLPGDGGAVVVKTTRLASDQRELAHIFDLLL